MRTLTNEETTQVAGGFLGLGLALNLLDLVGVKAKVAVGHDDDRRSNCRARVSRNDCFDNRGHGGGGGRSHGRGCY